MTVGAQLSILCDSVVAFLQVEMMAKQSMQAPVEIQVGGRSVVNKDITQYVEIRQHHERFMRLLEILGNWQEQGKVLVFVNSQEQCDKLFRDLLQVIPHSALHLCRMRTSLRGAPIPFEI